MIIICIQAKQNTLATMARSGIIEVIPNGHRGDDVMGLISGETDNDDENQGTSISRELGSILYYTTPHDGVGIVHNLLIEQISVKNHETINTQRGENTAELESDSACTLCAKSSIFFRLLTNCVHQQQFLALTTS
jgi:hypothetical protein